MTVASMHSGASYQVSSGGYADSIQLKDIQLHGAGKKTGIEAAATCASENAMPMSIDELVAYLETRLGQINQNIRDRMAVADKNNVLTKKASQLQSTLGDIGTDATPEKLTAAADEIDQMLKASAGSSDISDAQRQQLSGLSQKFKEQAALLTAAKAQDTGASDGVNQHLAARAISDTAKEVKEMLGTVVSSSSHTDQANLANLQSLVSQMGQATNLVSNMIAAFNEGMKSIISNTRS